MTETQMAGGDSHASRQLPREALLISAIKKSLARIEREEHGIASMPQSEHPSVNAMALMSKMMFELIASPLRDVLSTLEEQGSGTKAVQAGRDTPEEKKKPSVAALGVEEEEQGK